MNKKICDIKGCGKDAYHTVDVCMGWIDTRQKWEEPEQKFKPFEEGLNVQRLGLCDKHFKLWCRATYEAFFGKVKE
jgi:hypothetical protein